MRRPEGGVISRQDFKLSTGLKMLHISSSWIYDVLRPFDFLLRQLKLSLSQVLFIYHVKKLLQKVILGHADHHRNKMSRSCVGVVKVSK